MEWLKDLTREVFAKKDQIKPLYTSGVEIKPSDLSDLLPGINCRVCDESNCGDFAIRLLAKEKAIVRCAPLFSPEYKEKRQFLLELLQTAGFAVPGMRE
jgi:ArsR family metal-binding transcriptional regulator